MILRLLSMLTIYSCHVFFAVVWETKRVSVKRTTVVWAASCICTGNFVVCLHPAPVQLVASCTCQTERWQSSSWVYVWHLLDAQGIFGDFLFVYMLYLMCTWQLHVSMNWGHVGFYLAEASIKEWVSCCSPPLSLGTFTTKGLPVWHEVEHFPLTNLQEVIIDLEKKNSVHFNTLNNWRKLTVKLMDI